MMARGFVSRVTKDIDVIALRELEGDLIEAHPLPEWFLEITKRIASQKGHPINWIKPSTSLIHTELFRLLPPESWQELEEIAFGERLRVGFLGRTAQLHLKGYAIANRDEPRDTSDFKSLSPTEEEIAKVDAWLRTQELVPPGAAASFRRKVSP